MDTGSSPLRSDRRLLPGIVVAVAGLHLGLFALSGLGSPEPVMREADPPAFEVLLFRPPVPPPPIVPAPAPPSPQAGGGAPAAPSRIHVPPRPRPVPPELPAPAVQAPQPDLVVGVAPVATPQPGQGLGGQGTGQGTGIGSGTGPGTGSTPPRFVRGPSRDDIGRAHRRIDPRLRQRGTAVMRCIIQPDSRLDRCAVVSETPPGIGFGSAALTLAPLYRFQPPTENGQIQADQGVTVTVRFEP